MSRADHPARRWSALVVDDDPALQGLFFSLLARKGFVVDCAPNGRLAFEYIRRGAYSAIFLDLMMPEVNGLELLDRLERDCPALLRRIVIVTGAPQHVIEEINPSRVFAVIRKPFDIDHFMTTAMACAQPPQSALSAQHPSL